VLRATVGEVSLVSKLVVILFTFGWAAVIGFVVRALFVVWRNDRRLGTAVAVAIAGAFVGGALAPFSLWTHPPSAGLVAATSSTPVAPPIPASSPREADCIAGASIGPGPALGHIDGAKVGSNQVPPETMKIIPHGEAVELSGWIANPDASLGGGVCVLADGRPIAAVEKYGLDRPDVGTALGKPEDRASGVDVIFNLSPGSHSVALGVVAPGGTVIHVLGPPLQVVVR